MRPRVIRRRRQGSCDQLISPLKVDIGVIAQKIDHAIYEHQRQPAAVAA
jgi:hypothetical protein